MDETDHQEDIHQRHKQEVKELNAKIQALKHSVPKGDKKRKKQVTNEIAVLQAQLEQRHERELNEYKTCGKNETSITQDVEEKLTVEDRTDANEDGSGNVKKPSKAQKRREKKEQEERERRKRLEEGEKESENHSRNVEAQMFAKILADKNLEIYEVKPDGNCMFNAILYQKHLQTVSEEQLKELRRRTVDYMMEHKDDFLLFATNNTTGEQLSDDEFNQYCDDMQHTNAWGGHLELRAISHIYQQRVEIYQASSPMIMIGEGYHVPQNPPIRLSYHRHQYGLGEHYNALLSKDGS